MKNVSNLNKIADSFIKKLEKKALDPNFINAKLDEAAKINFEATKSLQNLGSLFVNARSDNEERRIQVRDALKTVGKMQFKAIKNKIAEVEKALNEVVEVL